MELFVTALEGLPVDEGPVEIVERKGPGLPDSICDASVERAAARSASLEASEAAASPAARAPGTPRRDASRPCSSSRAIPRFVVANR